MEKTKQFDLWNQVTPSWSTKNQLILFGQPGGGGCC